MLNSNKTSSTKESENPGHQTKPTMTSKDAGELCILHASDPPSDPPASHDTRNTKITNTAESGIPDEPLNHVERKMSRAESCKNSRRYPKTKSGLSQNRNQATILPSYLPLKKYMVKEMTNMKPVRQMHKDSYQHKKQNSKTPFSQRTGVSSTAKSGARDQSKETFEEFVHRARGDPKNRIRPYTSTGHGQVRIRTSKKPSTKSGIGTRYNPYLKSNRPWNNDTSYGKKHAPKPSQVKNNNLLGYAENSQSKGRGTFYPNMSDSLMNKTDMSVETMHNRKTHVGNVTTYYDRSTKNISKQTSCNQTTTADLSVDQNLPKPHSQRRSLITENKNVTKVFEMKQANTEKNQIDMVTQFYKSKAKTEMASTHTDFKVLNLTDGARNKTADSEVSQPPLPKNFKRIPAMMESLARKEELMKRANSIGRGRSESNNRSQGINGNSTMTRVTSSDRPMSIKDYKMGRQIGKGAYAVVKLVTERSSNQLMAMKVYEKYKLTDPARRRSVAREIAIMKKIDHESIVKMYTSFDNPHSIHIVMQYVRGRSLYQFLKERPGKKMPENEAKIIIKQIAECIQYCHSKNIVHRDMKLENIIINSKTKKITMIDFGFSIVSGYDKKLKIF